MREEFWGVTCGFHRVFVLLLAVNVVFLVLLALSVPFVTPGSDTYYVSLLSLPLIGVTLLGRGSSSDGTGGERPLSRVRKPAASATPASASCSRSPIVL